MRSFLLVIVLAAIADTNLGAHPQSKPQTLRPAFKLNITTPNETVKSGSSVTVDIRLTNTSQQTIVSSRWVGGPDYSFKIDFRDRQGKLAPFSEHYRAMLQGKDLPAGSSKHYYIGPGESTKEKLIVNEQYDLSAPGAYTIQVNRLDDVSKKDVKSNIITVTIVP